MLREQRRRKSAPGVRAVELLAQAMGIVAEALAGEDDERRSERFRDAALIARAAEIACRKAGEMEVEAL